MTTDVAEISRLLGSADVEHARAGLAAFLSWVEGQGDDVDLAPFGYTGDGPEPEPNPLFDELLARHASALGPDDLLALLRALLNGTEEWLNCGAILTASRHLLAMADDALQARWIDTLIHGLGGYAPGHRYYEKSVLDVLVDEVIPGLRPPALVRLVEWASDDLLAPPPGDNLIAAAAAALRQQPDASIERRLATRAAKLFTNRRDDLTGVLGKRLGELHALCSPDGQEILDAVTRGATGFAEVQRLFKEATTNVASLQRGLQALGGLSAAELKELREPFYKGIKVQGGKLSFDVVASAVEQLLAGHGANPDEKVLLHLVRYAVGFHHKKMIAALTSLAQAPRTGEQVLAVIKRARQSNPLDHEYSVYADGTKKKHRDNPFAKHDFNDAVKATIAKNLDAVVARVEGGAR